MKSADTTADMWEALLEWDRETFRWLNAMGTSGWDEFWLGMSDKWVAIPLYLLLLLLAWRQFGGKRTLILLVCIALLITCTDQLANFFKYGVGRLRPCHDPLIGPEVRLVKASCGGRFGFFSAHAANAFGVAVFFTTLWGLKKWWWTGMLLVWGVLVGYSRIYLGVHYPLDVAAGFLAGGIFGFLFARLFLRALQKWMP